MRYMVRNLRCTVTVDSVLANSKTQNDFLFSVHAIFRHDYPLAVEPASTPRPLVQKKTLRDSLPIDMILSAVYVLVVAQSSSEVPEGLMNNPVYCSISSCFHVFHIVHTYLKLSPIVDTYSHSPADNRLTDCYKQFVSSTAHVVAEVWLLAVEFGCTSSCCFSLLFVVCGLFLELECMLSVTVKEVVCVLLLAML